MQYNHSQQSDPSWRPWNHRSHLLEGGIQSVPSRKGWHDESVRIDGHDLRGRALGASKPRGSGVLVNPVGSDGIICPSMIDLDRHIEK
jgi:hypothetical protein